MFFNISKIYEESYSGTADAILKVKGRSKHTDPITYFIRRDTMNTYTEKLNAWDRIMMAITFAEAGEAETAREVLSKRHETRSRKESAKRPQLRV